MFGVKRVSAPMAYAYTQPKLVQPRMRTVGKGDFVVTGRELITTLPMNRLFTVGRVLANPGNPAFAWLSNIAKNYQFYRFRRLKFLYVPTVATVSQGRIMFNFEFDETDMSANSEQIFLNNLNARSGPYWKALEITVPLKQGRSMQRKYVTRLDPNAVVNPLDYFLGYMTWGSVGSTTGDDGLDAGQLFVEYDVLFSVPQTTDAAAAVPISYAQWHRNTNETVSTSTPGYHPVKLDTYDVIGIPGMPTTQNSNGSWSFPPGLYEVVYNISGALANAANKSYMLQHGLDIAENGSPIYVKREDFTGGVANMFRTLSNRAFLDLSNQATNTLVRVLLSAAPLDGGAAADWTTQADFATATIHKLQQARS